MTLEEVRQIRAFYDSICINGIYTHQDITRLCDSYIALEAERDALKAEMANMKPELLRLTNENAFLTSGMERLTTKIAVHVGQISDLQRDLQIQRESNADLTRRLKEAEGIRWEAKKLLNRFGKTNVRHEGKYDQDATYKYENDPDWDGLRQALNTPADKEATDE